MLAVAVLGAGFLTRFSASASVPPAGPLPRYDISAGVRGTTLPGGPQALAAGGADGGLVVRYSALTRTPSRLSRRGGALTGPSRQTAEQVVRQFLARSGRLFALSAPEVSGLRVTRTLRNPGLGVSYLTLSQEHQGIPVFGGRTRATLGPQGELLTLGGELIPSLSAAVNAVQPRIGPAQALGLALRGAGLDPAGLGPAQAPPAGPRMSVTFAPGTVIRRPATVELVYFPVGAGRVLLAWQTLVTPPGTPDTYQTVVDTTSGQLLFRANRTRYFDPHGLVYDREAPIDETPLTGTEPPLLDRVDVPFNGAEFFPPGDPHVDWWAGAPPTTTISNNVAAFEDRNADDAGEHASAPDGNFAFPIDLTASPQSYVAASTTNLFYWTNRMHDLWYRYGFDEAAGTYQVRNFGAEGKAGDPIFAQCQMGAALQPESEWRNMAFFDGSADGEPGQMVLFVFNRTAAERDAALVSTVIAHEYFHGVINRLVTHGPTTTQFDGLHEGLSDFAALLVHTRPDDDLTAPHGVGGYLTGNFQRGRRQEPYSIDHSVFTRTYGDIGDSEDPHVSGEIIANTMWQVFVRLAARHGFAEGRERARFLLIDALKLLPEDASFLDMRDAVLLADRLRYGGQDLELLWSQFADRGMGYSAFTAGGNDTHPQDGFDLPPAAEPDAFESDDTPEQAKPLPFDVEQERTLHAPGNDDWVSFQVDRISRPYLGVRSTGAGGTVSLFGPDSSTHALRTETFGSSSRTGTRLSLVPGRYYLKFSPLSGAVAPTEYGVRLVLSPQLVSLTADPPEVRSGRSVQLLARVNAPAPPAGYRVKVVSSHPSVLRVASPLSFPFDEETAEGRATARKVKKPTTVTLSLTLNGSTVSCQVRVLPAR